jgi:UDP-N-acetylglucosamine 2-epimerase (non-hydrolysing)
MTDITIAMGTRPEIIKMAPIIRELMQRDRTFKIAYTGQHYDYNLSLQFIEELNLPKPEYDLKVKEVSPGSQTGRIIIGFEKIIKKERPLVTLVEGDTNSVLATALASNKQNVTLGHVEAGLRSFDLRMPEEHNRRLVDHISDYLFAPTENARRNLEREGVWGKIYVTGNTVVDACQQHIPIAEEKSRIMEKIEFDEYLLATVHRAENVDDPRVLGNFLEAFMQKTAPSQTLEESFVIEEPDYSASGWVPRLSTPDEELQDDTHRLRRHTGGGYSAEHSETSASLETIDRTT